MDLLEKDANSITDEELARVAHQITRPRKTASPKIGAGVESPNFRRWFAGSKVVDQQGRPLRAFGARSSVDFEEFSTDGVVTTETGEPLSSGSGWDPSAFMGAHFAVDPKVADMFAMGKGWTQTRYEGNEEKPRVIPVYLRITNPKDFGSEKNMLQFIYQGKIGGYEEELLQSAMIADGISPEDEEGSPQKADEWYREYDTDTAFRQGQNEWLFERMHPEEGEEEMLKDAAYDLAMQARAKLQAAGHDGIRYKNLVEGGVAWIAFEPNQIKSAIAQQYDPQRAEFTAALKKAFFVSKRGYAGYNTLENALYEVEGDLPKVEAILAQHGAEMALAYNGGKFYEVGGAVVAVDDDGTFTMWSDVRDLLFDYNAEKFLPDSEEKFNKEFWAYPSTLYHGTDEDKVETILQQGLLPMDETRGLSNRSTGAAVFTSTDWDESGYYDTVLEIDTEAMKRELPPSSLPFAGKETDIAEGETREYLAHVLGDDDYHYDYEQGMSPNTVILHGAVPPKYIKVAKPGEIGCTVIRKSTGEKGTLLDIRDIMETNDAGEDVRQKYHGGNKRFLTVKWSRSGMDYGVYDSDVTYAQPKTAARQVPEPADWEDWQYASGGRWRSQFYIKAPETKKGYIPYTAVMQSWTDAEPGLPTFGNKAVSFLFLNADANLLGAYGTTNTGHVAEVFTKVGGLVMSALHDLRPPAMYFSAEGVGRAALYARMARLGASASGYIPYVVDQGTVTYFALVSPAVDADYRYWGKDVIQPLMTAKTAKTASEWGGFCPRCGSDQTAWAMHSATTDTYFCMDCKGSTDIERDMHPDLRSAMKIAGLVGYPWAIWEGKVLLSPRGMAHTDWFSRMGIPDRGPEFDRIPRGNFYIDKAKRQIYVWTDAETYDYSKNPSEESLDDTVVFGPWGGRRFDLEFTPPEVIEAIKRKYPYTEAYEVVDWMPPGSVHKWSSGEWWRRWRKTYLISKGTILYHGTTEDFPAMDIQTPAWFSTSESVAEYFKAWHGGEEGEQRILKFQVTKPIRLPRIDGSEDLERLADMFNFPSPLSGHDYVEDLAQVLPGWIIPHNYPDGDDILLVSDRDIIPINEPEEEEEEISQEGLPPGAWRNNSGLPGYWTREGTTTIYHMTPEEIAEREQRLQKRSAAEPVKAEEATWSRPLYHGTSAYRAKKIKAQKSFYGETEGYNEMGVGVYTHPSMNRTSPWAAGRAQGAFMELHFTRPLKLAVKNPQGEWVSSMGGESHRFISKAPTQRELVDAGYDGIYDKHGTTQVPHQVLLFNQPVLGSGGAHKLNQLIDWDKVRIINFNESQHGYLKGLENTEEAPHYRELLK